MLPFTKHTLGEITLIDSPGILAGEKQNCDRLRAKWLYDNYFSILRESKIIIWPLSFNPQRVQLRGGARVVRLQSRPCSRPLWRAQARHQRRATSGHRSTRQVDIIDRGVSMWTFISIFLAGSTTRSGSSWTRRMGWTGRSWWESMELSCGVWARWGWKSCVYDLICQE